MGGSVDGLLGGGPVSGSEKYATEIVAIVAMLRIQ